MKDNSGDVKQNSGDPLFTNLSEFEQHINCGFDDFFRSLLEVTDEEDRFEIIKIWIDRSTGASSLKEKERLDSLWPKLSEMCSDRSLRSITMGYAVGKFGVENDLDLIKLQEVNSSYINNFGINPRHALMFWAKNIRRIVSLDEIESAFEDELFSDMRSRIVVYKSVFREWLKNPINNVSFEEINFDNPPKFADDFFYEIFFQQERNKVLLGDNKEALKSFITKAKNKHIKISAVKSWLKISGNSFDFHFLEQEIFPLFENIIDKQNLVYEWFECAAIPSEEKDRKFLELIKFKPELVYSAQDDRDATMIDYCKYKQFPAETIFELCKIFYPESEFQRAEFFYQFVKERAIKDKEIIKTFIRNLDNRMVALGLFENIRANFSSNYFFDERDREEMIVAQRAYLLEDDIELSGIQTRDLISIKVIGDYLKTRILPIPQLLDNIEEYQFGESVVLGIDREDKLKTFKDLMKKEEITDEEAVNFFEETLGLGKGIIKLDDIDALHLNGYQRTGNLLRNNKHELAFLLAQDDVDNFIGGLSEIEGGCGAKIGTHVQTNVDRRLTQNIFDQFLLSVFQAEIALPILTQHGDRLGSDVKGAKLYGNDKIDSSFIRPEMLLIIVKEQFFSNGKLTGKPWDVIRCALNEDEVTALMENVLVGESFNNDSADLATYLVLQRTIPEVLLDRCFVDLRDRCESFISQAKEIVRIEQEQEKETEESKLMMSQDFDAPKKKSNRANKFREEVTSKSAENAAASRFVTNILGKYSGGESL